MADLREVRELIDRGASYEEYPDGVTWEDWQAAAELPDDEEDENAQ